MDNRFKNQVFLYAGVMRVPSNCPRDESPSGALSIQWFNEFIKTGDENILYRLLAYNEDDCKATMVLKQALEKLYL